MAKIKICGLTSLEEISYVNGAAVDFAGFIFTPTSKRFVTVELAEKMKQLLNSEIKSVGVFVDEKIDTIKKIVELGIIDLVQLHGEENEKYIKKLQFYIKKPIIKAFRANEELEKNIKNTSADYILIDSENSKQFGGTGKTFDYKIIPKTNKPLFIAGGLNAKNIENAIKLKPYCLDINSGVEINGKKDKDKILEIIKLIIKS